MSPNISLLEPKAFCLSIGLALEDPPDVRGSIGRIQKALNRLPEEKIYPSSQKDRVVFFTITDGRNKYLPKKSEKIYILARRRYLTYLSDIIKLSGAKKDREKQKRQHLIGKLQKFILACERGKLDITRIILTRNQQAWFDGSFKQKHIDPGSVFRSSGGVPVRSKSERDIMNGLESMFVPTHYEQQTVISVDALVDDLEKTLLSKGYSTRIYSFINGQIHWNVPTELESMNLPGSIWRSYSPYSGTITISPDFRIMLADGSFLIWEHEGLMQQFTYRLNASERGAVMKLTGAVDKSRFIETYEQEIDTPDKILAIIRREIVPRLWF